jgi:PhnB protein
MAQLTPYINFAGKTAEALEFYEAIFGGEADVQLAKEGPNAANTPADKLDQVFHSYYHNDHFAFMASDMMSDEAGRDVGNVLSLVLDCDSAEQLRDWFDKLADGGKVVWPVRDSEWGSMFAQATDKFGITWLLNYAKQ